MEKSKIRKKQGGGSARSGSRASRSSRGSGNSRSSGQPGTPVAGGSGQPASAASGSREPILSVAGGSGEPSHSAAGGSEQSSTPAGGSGQPSTPVASGSEQPNPHVVTGSEEPNPSAATLEHPDPPTADAGVQTTHPSGSPTVIHRNFPPEFWDELSRVWLTRRLVKEVGRRNYMDVPLVYERPQTRIALARFARHGGPDLCHLRNFRGLGQYSTPPSLPDVVQSTAAPRRERLSAYDRNLEQHLADHEIHLCQPPHLDQGPLPSNLAAITKRLERPILALIPARYPESEYARFQEASSERDPDIVRTLLPFLVGNAALPAQSNLPFDNLEPLTWPIDLVPAPAYFDGASPEALEPWVREDLGAEIVPTRDAEASVVPNFFIQARGRPAKADEEKRMAGLYGAYGARAMLALRNYGAEEVVYDGKAYTFSAVYNKDVLTLYAHHITAPAEPDGRPRYQMTRIRDYYLTMGRTGFLEGARALRNARDLAWGNREAFIAEANAVGPLISEEGSGSGE